jgi:hypothetical protein
VYLDLLQADGAGAVQKYVVGMDPAQLTVVALVRDESQGEVLQAIQVDPEQEPQPNEASL